MSNVGEMITRVHRQEWARLVATPARRFDDLDIAEEMAAEAFTTAVQTAYLIRRRDQLACP